MIASIRKFSKSIFAKFLVALIALPFVLWGMGDVFRSGNQNVIAEINEKKISTKEFMDYLRTVNITRDEIENKGKENVINEILTNYISEQIISIETEEKGIQLSDSSLKKILVSDEGFKKNGTFLRTKYEKFLLSNGITAPQYENNILNLETKGQLLSFYSGGIKLPEFLIDEVYIQENKSKEISFLDLNKVYSKKKISEIKFKEFYEKNKELFKDKFKAFKYLKLVPEIVTGKNEFDEDYFTKIDSLENDILDGKSFADVTTFGKEKIKNTPLINIKKYKKNGEIFNINNDIVNKVFQIKNLNTPSIINFGNEYYIVEILDEDESYLDISNKSVKEFINKKMKILNLIEENTKIIKEINNKKFNEKDILSLSQKNNVELNKVVIKNIKDKTVFSEILLKQIYNYNSGQIFIITDYPKADKNFLVKINKEVDPVIDRDSKIYKEYIKKVNSEYISKVYKSYDSYINSIYKIDINEKVLERLINSI